MSVSTVTRTHWTDDNGTGTTGTIVNEAELQHIYDAIDQILSGTGAYATLTLGGSLTIIGTLQAPVSYLQACTPLMTGYQERWQTVAAAAHTSIDLSNGNHVKLTLGASITDFTLTSSLFGIVNGNVQPLVLHIVNDGTGKTITWTINASPIRFSSGVAPTLTNVNGKVDRVVIYYMPAYDAFGEQIGINA